MADHVPPRVAAPTAPASRRRCANPNCYYLVHSVQTEVGPFCCGRCWGRMTGVMRGREAHGEYCERVASEDDVPRAAYSPSEQDRKIIDEHHRIAVSAAYTAAAASPASPARPTLGAVALGAAAAVVPAAPPPGVPRPRPGEWQLAAAPAAGVPGATEPNWPPSAAPRPPLAAQPKPGPPPLPALPRGGGDPDGPTPTAITGAAPALALPSLKDACLASLPPVSTAPYTLPPEQRILQPGETQFDLDRVVLDLTVVVSTSVGEFTPSTEKLVAALDSLQANVALRHCHKLLVFDQVPSPQEIEALKRDYNHWRDVVRGPKWEKLWNDKREAYGEYCRVVRAMRVAKHPALYNTELLFLQSFGHLFGTVEKALHHVATRYALIWQHDLRLAPRFAAADVQLVLQALHECVANYILLNRDVNSGPRSLSYFRVMPDQAARSNAGDLQLTSVAGFSDQAHFVSVAWYGREVLAAVPPDRQLTCMEHVLHERWKDQQEWRGTFLYGGTDDGPFVYDLVHGAEVSGPGGKIVGISGPAPARPVPT